MKKLISVVLVLACLTALFPLSVLAEAFEGEETLVSPHLAVYNVEKEIFVFTKDAYEKTLPGSSAKIMTGILALEYFEGRLDTKVTVTTHALKGLSGSAVLDLDAGEEIAVYDLLYAMLTAGMNDAANVLAIAVAGDITSFVSLMNEKAKELGAENTLYLNPTGFDVAAAYTTAADTARIAAYAYRNKTLMAMCSARAYTVPATNMSPAVTVYTRNALLTAQSEYYYKNAEGMSFGYTDIGGYSVVSAASHGTYPYICVALGAQRGETIGAYADVKKLLSWSANNFLERKILDSSKIVAELPVLAGRSDHVLIVPDAPVYSFLDADLDLSAVTYSATLDYESLKAPVKKGSIVGSILIILDGEPIGSTHLVTKTEIRKSAKGAFFLGVKTVLTHPVFIIVWIVLMLLTAFCIYRKYFYKRKPQSRHKKG